MIGLEIKPRRLWNMRREVLGLGSLQIIITGIVIGLYSFNYQPTWQAALLIGFALALSSTAFVLQLLNEQGEIATKHGNTAFSVLLMQDLAVVPLLALIPILSTTGRLSSDIPLWEQFSIVIGMLALVAGFGRYILPYALNYLARKSNKEGFLLTVMLAVFLAAWSMHQAGLSMALGAFVMGILLSGSRYRHQVQATVEPYKGILMSLFFVAVGMSIDLRTLAEQPAILLQHTLMIIIIKIIVLFLLALAFGYSRAIATRVAFLMAQGGEFGFVLFGSAKALELIDDRTFLNAIGVISISMLLTPVLMRVGNFFATRTEAAEHAGGDSPPPFEEDPNAKRVVIGGYGRVGHAVATLLHSSEIQVLAFDSDPERVAKGRADGLPVYYGDIGDPQLLASAHVEHASLVVITIDHGPTAERAVSHIRNQYPNIPVISRARDLEACGRLMEVGATHAYPEALESSLRLGSIALEMVNVPTENIDLLMQGVRSQNYQLITQNEDETSEEPKANGEPNESSQQQK
jgi:glutathione-regulated potassium-efflux system protein KefB